MTEEERERVSLARAWLGGFAAGGSGGGPMREAYFEDGTQSDRMGRLALAQLLIDGSAPQHILDLLAAALVPNVAAKKSLPGVPERLVRTGSTGDELMPESSRMLTFKGRTNARKRDPYLIGHILDRIQHRDPGKSIETACFDVTDELKANGVDIEYSGVKRIWDDGARMRKALWG